MREVRCVLFGAAALALLAACGSTQKLDPRDRMITPTADMTEREGQVIVMNYADMVVSRLSEKADELKDKTDKPDLRKQLNRGRLRYAQAVYDIAAGPNPGINLLDMVVLVTLLRLGAEDPNVGGAIDYVDAMEFVPLLKDLEQRIWRIAARVLTPEQMEELRALIVRWKEDNPDVIYYDAVRFEDWAAGRGVKPAVRKRSSVLFSAVGDISEQVDQVMLAADRLTYLLQRMPSLARWHAEIVYNEVETSPTVKSAKSQIEQLVLATDRISRTIETLPDRIDEMRKETLVEAKRIQTDAVRQLNESLARYQEQFWLELDERSEMVKSVSGDIRATMTEADKLAGSIDRVVQSSQGLMSEVRETVKELEKLEEALRPEADQPTRTAEPLTLDDYLTVIKEATLTVRELNELVDSTNELLGSPQLEKRMGDVDERVDNFFARVMELAVIFIVGLFGCLAGYRVALARLGARRERKSS